MPLDDLTPELELLRRNGLDPDAAGGLSSDLFVAFAGWFKTDDDLSTAFPVGILNQFAPPRHAYPYARYKGRDLGRPMTPDDRQFSLSFTVFAVSDDVAKFWGSLILSKLTDPSRDAFRWSEGGERFMETGFIPDGVCELMPVGKAGGLGNAAVAGQTLWAYTTPLKFDARRLGPDEA